MGLSRAPQSVVTAVRLMCLSAVAQLGVHKRPVTAR
jgi:hypothetical protein